MAAIIKINHADNVAVAVSNVTAGEVCQVGAGGGDRNG